MKFFIDTAVLDEIKRAAAYGVLDGVTTNPTLMAKVGIKGREAILQHYRSICELVPGNVSAEVIATDFEHMMDEAHELAAIDAKIVVKIPFVGDGVRAIKALSDEGIRTNCTLIFQPMQAIIAAKAGASYVSPFVGRLDDIATDGTRLIRDLVRIFHNYDFQTEILVASVRSPMLLVESAKAGADVATMPFTVIEQLFKHPLTDSGLSRFLADYEASQQ